MKRKTVIEEARRLRAEYADIAGGPVLILMRVGDFYEAFDEDARALVKHCGCALVTRISGSPPIEVDMSGFPHAALEANLQKLWDAGQPVAIAEQVK